jgi:hypothetical protein
MPGDQAHSPPPSRGCTCERRALGNVSGGSAPRSQAIRRLVELGLKAKPKRPTPQGGYCCWADSEIGVQDSIPIPRCRFAESMRHVNRSARLMTIIQHKAAKGRRADNQITNSPEGHGIMTTDFRLIAAHLAAAMISAQAPENAKGGSAAAAAKIYFDVLDAVMTEQKRRYASPTSRANA